MFGYVIANEIDLTEEERSRYRGFYCGLCRTLGERYGQLSRLGLTFDLTFLVIMLSSLYEPEESTGEKACPMHPFKKSSYIQNKFTDYCADLTVALTYYKCLDDWQDEKKPTRKVYADILRKSFEEVRDRRPRQCEVIDRCIAELSEIEGSGGSADEAAGCFGRLMAELFVYEEDFWAEAMRAFGNCLGQFIYLLDAAVDLEEDKKRGEYNPWLCAGTVEEDKIVETLDILMGKATAIFAKLPLVQDEHIMKSALFAGVWLKYAQKLQKQNKKEDMSDKEQANG